MNRLEKEELVSEIRQKFKQAVSVVVVRQEGLTVAEVSNLRRQMREAGVEFRVLKNTLARIAVSETALEGIEKFLEGPTALAISYDDPVNAAKVSAKFATSNPKLSLVAGYLDGQVLDGTAVKTLSQLPSLDELRSKVIAVISTPATRLAVLAKEPASLLARVTAAYGRQQKSCVDSINPLYNCAKEGAKMSVDLNKIVEDLSKLTVIQAAELSKMLEEHWGVSAAAPVAVAAVAAGGSGDAAEAKTEFDVILADIGANKINVIKVIREITGLGLKEAKDLVEAAPKAVKQAVSKEEADKLKKQIEESGAKVEIKQQKSQKPLEDVFQRPSEEKNHESINLESLSLKLPHERFL